MYGEYLLDQFCEYVSIVFLLLLLLGCFMIWSTYHCDWVDRVHDGEQQDVVLGKVPIV